MKNILAFIIAALFGQHAYAQVGVDITRAQIPSTTISAQAFTVAGFSSVDDMGIGCTYIRTGSSGPAYLMPVQDAGGTWFQLSQGKRNYDLGCFGAKGDGGTFDDAAIDYGIAAAQSAGYPAGGPGGRLHAPPGYLIRTQGNHAVTTPIFVQFDSLIYDWGTSGSLFRYGPAGGQWNANFSAKFAGVLSGNGNGSPPASINTSGRTAHEIINATFSDFDFGNTQGLTNRGIYCNGTGDVTWPQVIQHNTIKSKQNVYNGIGFDAQSIDAATSSCETNWIFAYDIYSNKKNMVFDKPGKIASTSNMIVVMAMDDVAPGGTGMEMYAYYNWSLFGYLGTNVLMQAQARHNTVYVQNSAPSGSVLTNLSPAGTNAMSTGP